MTGVLLGLFALAGGCVLEREPDRAACKDGDCPGVACSQSAECGGGFLCKMNDDASGQCVESGVATCRTNEDCAPFERARVCLPSGTCGRQCITRSDCSNEVPTIECVEGACVDPVWGCLGQPVALIMSGATGGFTIRIQNMQRDVDVGALVLRVCPPTLDDPSCSAPIAGAQASYDRATKLATVTGIPLGNPWRLVVETPVTADPEKRLTGIDYYMQRSLEAGRMLAVEEPLQLTPLQAAWRDAVTSEGIRPDISKGHILARTYDCTGRPAADVVYDIPGRPLGSFDYYFDENGLRNTELDRTDASGRGAFVNLTPAVPYTIEASTDGVQVLTKFRVAARPTTVTHVDLFPGRQ